MNEPNRPTPRRPVLTPRTALVGLVLTFACAAGALWKTLPADRGRRNGARLVRVRDVYSGSPYKNARPDVGYVGDEACARCHREIAEAYRTHPMGRSLVPVADLKEGPPVGAAAGLPIEDRGIRYSIGQRDGRVFHHATRQDAAGHPFDEVVAEVRYALGSGTRGVTYLTEHDGFLLQSPIAWFAQAGRWDISPGYGEFSARPNFERAIQPDCLFCHANRFRPVPGTINRYEAPIFQGHAIGCERCHGPGELHAGQGRTDDLSIVNPAKLTPALRDSVCQQCHLQGSFRFERAGRETFDYRPGLPLHRFLAVFLSTQGDQGKFEAVGHVEQMESSRCFVASKGELGCISCHDPHRLPAPAVKTAYYRGRCLECHQKKGCALPEEQRKAQGQGDDCVACHMPRPAVTNVPHTAATDHRVLRKPGARTGPPPGAKGPTGVPLLRDFHRAQRSDDEREDAARDLGVALGWAPRNTRSSPQFSQAAAAAQGLALLENAVRDGPDDLPAGESLGHVLAILGRPEDALRAFDRVLGLQPRRESALRSAGQVLTRLKRPDLARPLLQRAVAVNPWRSQYHLMLANVCGQLGDWPTAIAACLEAIRLNPEPSEARSMLIQCYLRSGQADRADAEFRLLVRSYPAGRAVWEGWYEGEKKAARGGAASVAPAGG